MASAVEIHGSSHHAEHLRPGKKRIVPLNLDLMGVVGDELQTGAFGIETWLQQVTKRGRSDSTGRSA